MENQIQRALRPIYAAIDVRQYSKALKLTQTKPQNTWPIVIALRCHCLERCGRAKEACEELRILLGVMGGDWDELDERIWMLSLDSFGEKSDNNIAQTKNSGPKSSTNSVKKKGKGGSKAGNKKTTTVVIDIANDANSHLDAVDALDLDIELRENLVKPMVETSSFKIDPLDISDEHTIATISITTGSLRLPRTWSKLYAKSIQILSKSSISKTDLCNAMGQAYLSHLKQISQSVSFSQREKITNARNILKAWEEAQFLGMSLAKNSGEGLYQSWCVMATLEHYKSCKNLLELLSSNKSDDFSTSEEREKMNKKITMLPRLAEMLALKTVKSSEDSQAFSPSADDYRLLIECLSIQEKYDKTIEVLENMRLESVDKRKINDENDVRQHVGSLVQITERERLELISKIMVKLGRKQDAFEVYTQLLNLMPDQWTYWQGLLEHAEDTKMCEQVLSRILEKQDVLKATGKGPKVPLRGPQLFQVELAAKTVIQSGNSGDLSFFSQAIISYGETFAPLVFCCFQDLRAYIDIFIKKSYLKEDAQQILLWAKKLRESNDPTANIGDEIIANKQVRRSQLRAYVTSVKVCFEVWYRLLEVGKESETINKYVAQFVPTPSEMVHQWSTAIDLGSNPKDGGQKEGLPGDDLILLSTQLLIHRSIGQLDDTRKRASLLAAGILEHAIHHSPYNAYLKLAAIRIHAQNGAAARSWEIFKDMDVKHIQLDSCSYFILPHLLDSGLYKEAIEQAGKIISLHSASEKDVCSFMAKSLENGNLLKGREMINWQLNEMSRSLQMLEAKGVVMDLAPLLNYGNLSDPKSPPPLGSVHGLCGGVTDGERVEKIVRDAGNYFAAPSLIKLASDNDFNLESWSDNRDFTVNQFEVLVKNTYEVNASDSYFRAHVHSVLTKLVLMTQLSKAPKKGKIVKIKEGGGLAKRADSLLRAIHCANTLSSESSNKSNVRSALLKAFLDISLATSAIVAGRDNMLSTLDESDSCARREEMCIPLLESARNCITEAIEYWKNYNGEKVSSICRILPDILVTFFVAFRTTGNMCDKMGWGKRKRHTKPVSKYLSEVALAFKELVSSMLAVCNKAQAGVEVVDCLEGICADMEDEHPILEINGISAALGDAIGHVSSTSTETKDRIIPILMQMDDECSLFDVKES